MKVEKDPVDINVELQILANDEVEARIEEQYQEFLEEMYQLWELEQYDSDSYDRDAQYYGE